MNQRATGLIKVVTETWLPTIKHDPTKKDKKRDEDKVIQDKTRHKKGQKNVMKTK